MKDNIARGKNKCEKMIRCASLNEAKTLLKAQNDNDLERYSARTIGFYKQVMKELNNKKEREKRAAQKALKVKEESGDDDEPKKPKKVAAPRAPKKAAISSELS